MKYNIVCDTKLGLSIIVESNFVKKGLAIIKSISGYGYTIHHLNTNSCIFDKVPSKIICKKIIEDLIKEYDWESIYEMKPSKKHKSYKVYNKIKKKYNLCK